jgi:hypothetical protein
MKTLARLICGIAGGHFVLCWLVIGILQWFSWDYFFWFGRELFLPLIPLEVTLWPPYNWFTFILTFALNSSIWGVGIGLLLYGVRRTFYKPVDQQFAGANRRLRWPFRCSGSRRESAVAQLSTLGASFSPFKKFLAHF